MTGPAVRTIAGTPSVVVPAGPQALVVAELLRWVNDWRVRNGQVPIASAALLADALRFACRIADILEAVPAGEHVMAHDLSDAGGWVTTTAAASILGIGVRGVRQRINRGRLPARRAGSVWLVRPEDLKAS